MVTLSESEPALSFDGIVEMKRQEKDTPSLLGSKHLKRYHSENGSETKVTEPISIPKEPGIHYK